MKANAPEKIYVYIPDDDIVGTASTQKSFPHQFVTEEYARKDAFIEKAAKFFIPYIQDNSGGYERAAVIKAFRNYMKEE